ncbi:ribose-phosphate pyrophosphokinase [bacterium]|nr:ribose-phosphate pyrophosphokinase [candidate division CSSED10-310 bacterium]
MRGINPDEMALLLFGKDEFLERLVYFFSKAGMEQCILEMECKKFNNSELHVHVAGNIRRKNVYVVANFLGYNCEFDPNIGYMRLFIINDVCRRASAAEINDILPFIPYLRQDRKDKPRVPISAKLFANLTEHSGADRLVTVDMHVDQIQGFYDLPVDHFTALPLFAEEFFEESLSSDEENLFCVDFFSVKRPINPDEWIIVATDAGAMKRARDLKTLIYHKYKKKVDVAMLEKTRVKGEPEVHYLVGNVEGKNAIIVDDIVDTAGTLIRGLKKLRDHQVKDIYVCATHGIFSNNAEERLRESGIRMIITDSIPRSREYLEDNRDWLKVRCLAPLLAKGITRIQKGESVSELFHDLNRDR